MTEDSQDTSIAPGSGAGDAAPTQAIPRLPRTEAPKPEAAAAPNGTQPATAAPNGAQPAAAAPNGTQSATAAPNGAQPATAAPNGTRPAVTRAPVKKAPAKKAPSAPTSSAGSSAQTDKGRPRAATPPAKPEATLPPATPTVAPGAASTGSSSAAEAAKKRQMQPVGGPQGRPLTAADYARTTKPSPSTTAVIPAVKDKDRDAKAKDGKKSSPKTTFAPSPAGGTGRRASLRLAHVEPWSVTRLAFTISVAMMIVLVVAATIFWVVLDVAGVWDQINDSFTTVLSDDSSSFNVRDYFGFSRVIGLTLVLSALNVVLMTLLATIGAHLYNLAAQLMGGVEVTFAEEK